MGYLGPSLRREKRKDRPLRRLAGAIGVSLLANALILWLLALSGAFTPPRAPAQARVALAPISAGQWEANRRIAQAPLPGLAPAPARPLPPPPPPEEKAQGRIVELSPNQRAAAEPPPSAKFLSDRNTRVEKETVSRYAGNFPRVAPRPEAGAPGKAEAAKPPAPAPSPQRPEQVGQGGSPGKEGALGEQVARRGPGELRLPELGEQGVRGQGGTGQPDLSVSREALARIAGGPNLDGVREGLPEGEETWLQSREFKYATYMNQMRREIGQQWFPRIRDAQKDRDPDGSVFFYKERTVVLALVLDTSGAVKDLSVLQSSNVDFFDRIAVSSVQAAQPFPNPPRGMFHDEASVRIPFSFTMYPGDRHGGIFWRVPGP